MKRIIEELREINSEKIKELEYSNENKEELEKQLVIKDILETSDTCFFEIPMETALQILSNLVEEEKINETYEALISYDEFKKYNNSKK